MDYLVKQGEFEGPIHLLLELIQEKKLHVSEISLAAVTEDFLKFLTDNTLSHIQVSSFIVVASTMILIKARSLLPTMSLTTEEEESIHDLTERVRQYQLVQKYASGLAEIYNDQPMFERVWVDKNPVFAPDPQMNTSYLQEIIQSIFTAFPLLEKLPEKTMKVVVRLEEMIENLTQRIQSGITFHTRDIMEKYKGATNPVERREAKVFAVVSFLAILELVKKGIGNVAQGEQFGNIEFS